MIKKKITGMMLGVLLFSVTGVFTAYAAEPENTVSSDNVINDIQPENNESEVKSDENPEHEVTEQPVEHQIIVTEIVYIDNPEQVNDEISYEMPETEYIAVQDIVVSEFKDTMYAEETQNISATVFPATATDNTVSYSSSDWSVAKVDKLGKVTAVGKGSCVITVSCGGKYSSYNLTVKIKTEAISVKSKFIVLKPGQKYALEAKAVPDNAPQTLKYKSQDTDTVTVDATGAITAVNNGSTSVIITNDDYTMSVNVIVNTDGKVNPENAEGHNSGNSGDGFSDSVAELIQNSAEDTVTVSTVDKITSEALRVLYGTDKTLVVECSGYEIHINGRDIINADHDFDTRLNISETEKGIVIKQDENSKLPGKISIKLTDSQSGYRYMYMCGPDEGEYRKLNVVSDKNMFSISSSGEYIISEKKLEAFRINIVWIAGAAGIILALSVVYIFTKRKYWFW